MPYVVHLKRSAEKELADLPREAQQRIIKRLLTLKANARPPAASNNVGCFPLARSTAPAR